MLVARAVLDSKLERQIPNSPARDPSLIARALPTYSIFFERKWHHVRASFCEFFTNTLAVRFRKQFAVTVRLKWYTEQCVPVLYCPSERT